MSAVEWKKLGDVCEVIAPPTKIGSSSYSEIGMYPIIDQGQKNVVGYTNDEGTLLPENEYVLFGDHTRYVKYFNGRFAQGADGLKILATKDDINTKYFFYTFANIDIPSRGYSRHWSIAKELEIPIPSLAKQQEIVSHLDTFTTLISNLESELDMRRKQYEHYRNQLLDFEGVEIKLLKELATVKRGVRVVKTDLEEFGEIPVYQNSLTPLGYKESNNRNKNTTFVICAGAAGDIGFSDVDFWAADDCSTINCGEWLIDKYIYHVLITKQSFLKSKVRKASVPRLASSFIENLEVPVPSIKTQQEIVSKLDAFENLIQSLEQEIKLRKQQYEYYREKLLTFEKGVKEYD